MWLFMLKQKLLIAYLPSFLGVVGCALEDDVDKENNGNWIFSKEGLDWVLAWG